MNTITSDAPPAPRPAARNRARFELAFASGLLAFGLFALPAIIFVVGVALLGPYGETGAMGAVYADFFRDLAQPSGRTWALALGPLLLVSVVRLLWLRRPGQDAEEAAADDDAMHKPDPVKTREQKRIEPSVSSD